MLYSSTLSKHEITTVYEDAHLVVINKPCGLTVNNSLTSNQLTLQNMLPLKARPDVVCSEFETRSGLVHRLDKATSGLLLIAKDEECFTWLQAQFKERKVKKEYVAVVYNKLTEAKLEINVPITRDVKNRRKFAVSRLGRAAKTVGSVANVCVKNTHYYTVLRLYPESGRTHQLRVHMCAIGHCIVGDLVYGSRKLNQQVKADYAIDRMLLHAHRLEITYPCGTTGRKSFVAPLPTEFTPFIS